MRLRLILLSGCFLLTSCSAGHWVNRSKPITSLDADISQCNQQAKAKFPAKMSFRARPSYTDVSSIYGPSGLTVRPNQQTDIQLQDVNEDVRDSAFKKCMNSMGWHLEYDK